MSRRRCRPTEQCGATLLFAVSPGERTALEAYVRALPGAAFDAVTPVHFLSIGIIPAGDPRTDHLLVEINFDGGIDALTAALWRHQPGVPQLIEWLVGARAKDELDFNRRVARADQGDGTLFVALAGMSRTLIDADQQLLAVAQQARTRVGAVGNARDLWRALRADAAVTTHCARPHLPWADEALRARLRWQAPAVALLLSLLDAFATGLPGEPARARRRGTCRQRRGCGQRRSFVVRAKPLALPDPTSPADARAHAAARARSAVAIVGRSCPGARARLADGRGVCDMLVQC